MRVFFCGPKTNLGRFGHVQWGDELELSEHEFNMLMREKDERFKPIYPEGDGRYVKDQKCPEKPAKLKKLEDAKPDDESAEDKAKREAEEAAAEKARQEQLEKANGADTALIDLGAKSKDELVDYGNALIKQGYSLDFKPTEPKGAIMNKIKIALKNPPPPKK
jgi:hypothetical protein